MKVTKFKCKEENSTSSLCHYSWLLLSLGNMDVKMTPPPIL